MIRAIYRDGKIEPVDELPGEWHNGEPLEIRPLGHPLQTGDAVTDTDDWINERGAYANWTGPPPQHVLAELERRQEELHALGPMEFEPGEEEEIEKFLKDMDDKSRREMERLGEEH